MYVSVRTTFGRWLHSQVSHSDCHAEGLVRVFGSSELQLLAHEFNEAIEVQKLSCVWIVPCADAWSVNQVLNLWKLYITQRPGIPRAQIFPGVIRLPCHRKCTRLQRKPVTKSSGTYHYSCSFTDQTAHASPLMLIDLDDTSHIIHGTLYSCNGTVEARLFQVSAHASSIQACEERNKCKERSGKSLKPPFQTVSGCSVGAKVSHGLGSGL